MCTEFYLRWLKNSVTEIGKVASFAFQPSNVESYFVDQTFFAQKNRRFEFAQTSDQIPTV